MSENSVVILKVIALILVIINTLSFTIWVSRHRTGAKLQIWREARSGKKMNYLIAGIMDQPQPVYRFLKRDLEGGITYVNNSSCGWSSKTIAAQIMNDIREHNYTDITVFSISIGDRISRYLECYADMRIRIVSINPCSHPSILKLRWRILTTIISILITFVSVCLGWLSLLPIIPAINGRISLTLIADQLIEMCFDCPPQLSRHTIGVIASKDDEFLDNRKICSFFQNLNGENFIMLKTKHAYTVREPVLYQEAVRKLLNRQTE